MVSGLIVALMLPRGPVTVTQALLLMFVGLGVGSIAGLVLRSDDCKHASEGKAI